MVCRRGCRTSIADLASQDVEPSPERKEVECMCTVLGRNHRVNSALHVMTEMHACLTDHPLFTPQGLRLTKL